MKLLIDMSLSPLWVGFFALHQMEAVHWSTVGAASAPDAEIMEFAGVNGFIVFTHDLDFGTLLATRGSHGPSVIQVRTQDVLPSAIGEAVLRAIRGTERSLIAGALVTVELGRQRIRILPI
jgi:predicted nuclease of predicted toxin-antitoxin system